MQTLARIIPVVGSRTVVSHAGTVRLLFMRPPPTIGLIVVRTVSHGVLAGFAGTVRSLPVRSFAIFRCTIIGTLVVRPTLLPGMAPPADLSVVN
jgi:hypothetical protein